MKRNSKFIILSVDGGGIRGAFAAQLLFRINELINIKDLFSFYAGTSTGSIITSCLLQNVKPSVIVRMYQDSSKTIFKRRHNLAPITPIFLEKALRSPYDNLKLKAILRRTLSKVILKNVRKPILIVATNLSDGLPCLFKSYDKENSSINLYKAVTASCAAPTFFDPLKINDKYLADGAIFANNPSLLAISDAINKFKIDPQYIKVLSIGSGILNNCYKDERENWGLVNGWRVQTLTEFVASLQSESTHLMLESFIPKENILRLNFENNTSISSDDFNSVDYLIKIADYVFAENKNNILAFLSKVY